MFSLCIREQNSLAEGISETCTTQGCKTKPNYNYEGQAKVAFCYVHKKEEMIDVKKGHNQITVTPKVGWKSHDRENSGVARRIHQGREWKRGGRWEMSGGRGGRWGNGS